MKRGVSQTVTVVLMIAVSIIVIVGLYFFATAILGPPGKGKPSLYLSVEPVDPAKGTYIVTNPSNTKITLDHLETTDGVRCDFGKLVTIEPGGHAECIMPTKKCKFVVFGETVDGESIAPFEVVISNCDSVPVISYATMPTLISGMWVQEIDEFKNGTFFNTSVSDSGLQLYKKLVLPPLLEPDVTLTGSVGENSGFSVTSGDSDDDGRMEAVIGAPGSDAGGTDSGKVYAIEPTMDKALENSEATITGVSGDLAGWSVTVLSNPSVLAVGAPTNDDGGHDSGAVYLFSLPISGVLTPNNAKATLHGSLCENFGASVANAGDVDGDRDDDLLVGTIYRSLTSTECAGAVSAKVYLFDGSITGEKNTDDAIATFDISLAGFEFNYSVAGAGDVNNDGYDDIIIGVPAYSYGVGKAYLFYGPVSGLHSLNDADVVFVGDTPGSNFGYKVAGADLNNDNFSDLVISAPGTGTVYVFYGPLNGSLGPADANATLTGAFSDDEFGKSIINAGDVDGDGFEDIAVGAPGTDYFGDADAGLVYVFYGPLTGSYNLSNLTYRCTGNQFVGDVNGDGVVDLRDLFTLSNVIGLGFEPICFDPIELLSMGEISIGGNGTGTGDQPICCGDVNGDGTVDFMDWLALKNYIIGASQGFTRGYSCEAHENCFDSIDNDLDGKVDYEDNDCPPEVDTPEKPAPKYAIFMGSPVTQNARTGSSLASADFNGDGFSDLLIGAPFDGTDGKTFVVFGGPRKAFLPSGAFESKTLQLEGEANFFNITWYWNQQQNLTLYLDKDGTWNAVQNNTSPGFSAESTKLKAVLTTNSPTLTPVLRKVELSYRSPTFTNLVYFINYEDGIKWVELKQDGQTLVKENVKDCSTFYAKTLKIDTSRSYEVVFEGCDGQQQSKKLF